MLEFLKKLWRKEEAAQITQPQIADGEEAAQITQPQIAVGEEAAAPEETGIRILYGEYGDCDYCIGYDYKYRVFVAFSPDDNYYHWNDYHICPIDRATAIAVMRSYPGEYPETTDPEAAKRYYAHASTHEIRSRVIKGDRQGGAAGTGAAASGRDEEEEARLYSSLD